MHSFIETDKQYSKIRTWKFQYNEIHWHHAQFVQAWFQAHPQFTALYLPPYSPFLNPFEDSSPHGRCMIGTLMNKLPFSRPLMGHAITSRQTSVRPGFAMPGDSFRDVCQMKISIAMWTKSTRQGWWKCRRVINPLFCFVCLFFEPGEEHCSTCFTYWGSFFLFIMFALIQKNEEMLEFYFIMTFQILLNNSTVCSILS